VTDETPGRLPPPIYDPSRDERRAVPPTWLDQAPVTRALLALNIGVYFLEVILSCGAMRAFSLEAILARALTPAPGVEMQLGASYALATVGEGRWETLVTACFIHGSVLHIGFNMVALWQAGPLVERAVGSARMAPMYLLSGAFGNLLSIASSFVVRSHAFGTYSVGASGAISGVIAAALVLGWRLQGWRGPLTQAMARWLGFVVIFGVLSNLSGGNIDNAAHIGGALAGGIIAAAWRRGQYYPPATTRAVLATCVAVVAVCIGVLSVREATNPFASMLLQERWDFTMRAVADGRCRDAHDGLLAVERLRGPMDSLRKPVEMTCGHVGGG
jgi:rhomboid protease GluP